MEKSREIRESATDIRPSSIENERTLKLLTEISRNEPSLELEIDGATHISSGDSNSCFQVQSVSGPVVVKISSNKWKVEADILHAWGQNGVCTPNVLATKSFEPRFVSEGTSFVNGMGYLVLEGITFKNVLAPRAVEYLDNRPEEISDIGELSGEELNKIHLSVTDLPFGECTSTSEERFSTYGEYLNNIVAKYSKFLLTIGITEDQLSKVVATVKNMQFPAAGTLIHGDFGPHNILVTDNKGQKTCVIDPRCIVADPYLDLAYGFHEAKFRSELADMFPDDTNICKIRQRAVKWWDSCVIEYQKSSDLDNMRLLTNWAIGMIPKIQYREEKLLTTISEHSSSSKKLQAEIKIQRQIIKNKLIEISSIL